MLHRLRPPATHALRSLANLLTQLPPELLPRHLVERAAVAETPLGEVEPPGPHPLACGQPAMLTPQLCVLLYAADELWHAAYEARRSAAK